MVDAVNPKDPMLNVSRDNARELFAQFGRVADGFTVEDVVNAAANVLVNAIRQRCATRQEAEAKFDEIFGRTKQTLVDHYDASGRKRGIFPYDQVIQMPHVNFRKN